MTPATILVADDDRSIRTVLARALGQAGHIVKCASNAATLWRWIANGEQHDEGNNFLDWNPSRTYHWRLEWGPGGGGNTARVYLDGRLMITVNYNRAYRPNVLYIELGIGERGESIVGAKYSNLQIGN